MRIKALKVEHIILYLVLAFGVFPLLPDVIKGILVFLLFFFTVLWFFKTRPKNLNYKLFIINASLYLVYLYSVIYSENITRAIKVLSETRLSAIIFPLTFLLLSANKEFFTCEMRTKFKNLFVLSTLIFCVFFLCSLPFQVENAIPYFQFPSTFFFRNTLTSMPFIGVEPIYCSIYIGISFIFVINDLLKVKKTGILQVIYLITFTLVLIALSSKMAILGVLIVCFVSFFFYFKLGIKQKLIALFL
jgi:hypothetical protein